MPRVIESLTDVKVRNVKPKAIPFKVFDGRGLFLIVTPNGGKWWRLKYRHGGKQKLISLGTYPDVGLKDARSRRDEARRLVAAGVDPSAARQEAKAVQMAAEQRENDSFEAVAREWFAKFSTGWVSDYADLVIERLEADVFPWLGGKPIADIAPVELLKVLRRIEARGAIASAHRVKQNCGQVFRYAIATGKASRDPSQDLRGALTPDRVKHFAAFTQPNDVARLIRAIDNYTGTFVVKSALKFSAITFTRPGEIRQAEWTEIDLDGELWRIPAERMKMRREHLVPLSHQAVELLRELHPLTGRGRYIFPGRTQARPMSNAAITAALRYMGFEKGQMTAHGFRSMASTMLNEQGWPADVIERQLAHVERNETRGAYNRAEWLEDRRKMMQHWSDYLDKLMTPAEVIPLQGFAPDPRKRG